jgi:hypothetical protein
MSNYETELAERRARLATKHKEMAAKFKAAGRILKLTEVKEAPREDAKAWDAAQVSFIMGPKGAEMFLRFDAEYGDGRVHVSGVYPRDAKGQYIDVYNTEPGQYGKIYGPNIKLSPDKTAEQIATNIKRRFIPDYAAHLAKVMERVNANNDYESTTAAVLELLKGASLTEYERNSHTITAPIPDGLKLPGREYDVRINVKASRGSITLELNNLDAATASNIIQFIRREAKK